MFPVKRGICNHFYETGFFYSPGKQPYKTIIKYGMDKVKKNEEFSRNPFRPGGVVMQFTKFHEDPQVLHVGT